MNIHISTYVFVVRKKMYSYPKISIMLPKLYCSFCPMG